MEKTVRESKPFPHRCPECGAEALHPETVTYRTTFKHEGRVYEFDAPNITLNKCTECGSVVLPTAATDQIADAFRSHIGLLTAHEILKELDRLGLTQRDFAEQLGIAPETVSRWLSHVQIQSRAIDRFMRVFFGIPSVRAALASLNDGESPRQLLAS